MVEHADLPVACALGADDGPARMKRWAALGERAHPVAVRHGGTLEVRWEDGPGVVEELEVLAAAERECCSFVTWSVVAGAAGPVLRVAAPPGRPDDVAPIAGLFGVG